MSHTTTDAQGRGRVLLTGATGFVGSSLHPALVAAGWDVRCASRNADSAEARWPDRSWVQTDVADGDSVARALEGCDAAFYLVHGMAGAGEDFRRAEISQAETFLRAAESAGTQRIVYLGGVTAEKDPSVHLKSRAEVGETLRSGRVSAIELRASMIIGYGSLSWLIVRDLAARLPVMVLPRWLRSRTEPVGIDDMVIALVRSIDLDVDGSAAFDTPGPEILSGREILERTARDLGLREPIMIEVPFLSPRLSSHWVRFVTRAEWSVAREVVVGLREDLLAADAGFWTRIGHTDLLPFDESARRALEAEAAEGPETGAWGALERGVALLRKRRA